MGKNQYSLILGLIAALAIIGWTMYSTDTESKNFNCLEAYSEFVFDSEQHCMDEVNKCTSQIPHMTVTMDYVDKTPQCFDMNGIPRR